MIEQLISRVFTTRNAAHIAHWIVRSGYNHETLGSFYSGVISSLDSIVESSIAMNGDISISEIKSEMKTQSITKLMRSDLEWIDKNRDKITGKNQAIDNMLQELEGCYIGALFKLENLA